MFTFISRKNAVSLTDDGNILKTFENARALETERAALRLLDGRLAPKLLAATDNSLVLQYVKGDLLLDRYLTTDEYTAAVLAASVAETVRGIHKLTDGLITVDENFRNYIVTENGCVRIDFEEASAGTLTGACAKLSAFAVLYEVRESVKLCFVSSLFDKLCLDSAGFLSLFETELSHLSSRWNVLYPTDLFSKIAFIIK